MKSPLVVVILGPTAVGKSSLAMEVASAFDSEIINFDSVQLYRELDIGAAKPSLEDRQKITHHLIDILEPWQDFSAGDFRREALKVIDERGRHKPLLILVGGTGFYLQALLKGMHGAPLSDPDVKIQLLQRMENEGLSALFEELQDKDPETADEIKPQDSYRVLRALEIMVLSGKTPSQVRREFLPEPFPYPILQVGLRKTRELLREVVAKRAHSMVEQGVIDEVERLIQKYVVSEGRKIKPLSSVGYKEVVAYLTGRLERDHLEEAIVKSTMALAKRQMTWFKRDHEIKWFDGDESGFMPSVLTEVRKSLIDNL